MDFARCAHITLSGGRRKMKPEMKERLHSIDGRQNGRSKVRYIRETTRCRIKQSPQAIFFAINCHQRDDVAGISQNDEVLPTVAVFVRLLTRVASTKQRNRIFLDQQLSSR